jgi:hypothetical protein
MGSDRSPDYEVRSAAEGRFIRPQAKPDGSFRTGKERRGARGGNMVSPMLNDADPFKEERYGF